MTNDTQLRDDFLRTLTHVSSAFTKLVANSGNGKTKILSFPDLHKCTEGLLLNAWTYWEQFLRRLFILDLAADSGGALRKEIKKFRSNGAPLRVAELLLDHPDEGKWIEWSSFEQVKQRGDDLLSPHHRYGTLGGTAADIKRLKKIRNAIAHKSDKAWDDFKKVVQIPPYSLKKSSLMGITTGRFLSAHRIGSVTVFEHSIAALETAANRLVP